MSNYFTYTILLAGIRFSGRVDLATPIGFEPTTSSVTGWHSNHLNYGAILCGFLGILVEAHNHKELINLSYPMADREGFEPPEVLPSAVFKTAVISQTLPSVQISAHYKHFI